MSFILKVLAPNLFAPSASWKPHKIEAERWNERLASGVVSNLSGAKTPVAFVTSQRHDFQNKPSKKDK